MPAVTVTTAEPSTASPAPVGEWRDGWRIVAGAAAGMGTGGSAPFGRVRPRAVAQDIESIHRDVAQARKPIVDECRRLWRSFDTVHRSATGHAGERREHVEPAVLRDDRVHRRSGGGFVGDVGLLEPGELGRRADH